MARNSSNAARVVALFLPLKAYRLGQGEIMDPAPAPEGDKDKRIASLWWHGNALVLRAGTTAAGRELWRVRDAEGPLSVTEDGHCQRTAEDTRLVLRQYAREQGYDVVGYPPSGLSDICRACGRPALSGKVTCGRWLCGSSTGRIDG